MEVDSPEIAAAGDLSAHAARRRQERRTLSWRTLAVGAVRPRRRGTRRAADHGRQPVDWHDPLLLALVLGVLILSVADALFTLTVLNLGAREINPLMDLLIRSDVRAFAIWKMLLTGGGLVVLVAFSCLRVFRILQVRHLLQAVFWGYCALTLHHLSLLDRLL